MNAGEAVGLRGCLIEEIVRLGRTSGWAGCLVGEDAGFGRLLIGSICVNLWMPAKRSFAAGPSQEYKCEVCSATYSWNMKNNS